MSQYTSARATMTPEVRIAAVPVSRRAEYIYYCLLVYGGLSVVWGVYIPFLAAGGVVGLAMYCVARVIRSTKSWLDIYKPIMVSLGCAVTFLLVQIFIHNESVADENGMRVYIVWILTMVIVQSLLLRAGFFHRFALAILAVGVLLLPNLVLNYGGEVVAMERAGLDTATGMGNPNTLAGWFGFLTVYFFIFGMESKRTPIRVASLVVVVGSLLIVGLTVSRGALVGIVIAITVALRRQLKRHFVPTLLFVIAGSVLLLSGVIDQFVGLYTERGMEDTGRLSVWPLAIERFLNSPIFGVGGSKYGTWVPAFNMEITPHNSFIMFALTSGIVPFVLFVAYWIKAAKGACRLIGQSVPEAPFILPLLLYTCIACLLSASDFMMPWAVATLTTAVSAAVPRRVHYLSAHQLRSQTILYRKSATRT